MKEKFINSSISFISKYQECNELKIKQLKYGLEGIYSVVVKITAVIIIALLTKTITETLLFLLFYSCIRTFSYGLHAKSNIACWITTIFIYNVIPIIFKSIIIPTYISYIVLGISLISMILWSPADTPKKPLIRKENRKKCKIFSILVVLIYTIIILLSKNTLVTNTITYALIVQCILINPLSYKITKTQFNSYKHYKKKIN